MATLRLWLARRLCPPAYGVFYVGPVLGSRGRHEGQGEALMARLQPDLLRDYIDARIKEIYEWTGPMLLLYGEERTLALYRMFVWMTGRRP